MIHHAMRYVSLGERVLATVETEKRKKLRRAITGIEDAESNLVRAYGVWRDAIKELADDGNVAAQRAHEGTTWDLT